MQPISGLLSALIFLPVLESIIIMLLPRPAVEQKEGQSASGGFDFARDLLVNATLLFTVSNLLLAIVLFGTYHPSLPGLPVRGLGPVMQFRERLNWIPLGGGHWVEYHLGVDGISVLLILLTNLVILVSAIYAAQAKRGAREMVALLLLLEGGLVGAYSALDLVLFYLFYEATLIPTYLIVGQYGGPERGKAAIKFFLYTFLGSVLMLVAIAAIYHYTGTFDLLALSNPNSAAFTALHKLSPHLLMLLFGAFALAFAIKTPMFPFHTWLPDAYVEAPAVGSVALVLLKTGVYGFVRICLPIFAAQVNQVAPFFIVLGIIGIVYGAIVAAIQSDAKRLVAYSSVSHMGFVVLGIFSLTRIGLMGALLANLSHGLTTPLLFLGLGMLEERCGTRLFRDLGGLRKVMPTLATLLLIGTFSSMAVPFFSGFVGEFPVLLGSWISSQTATIGNYWPTAVAGTGMILSTVYILWWYQRLMLGPLPETYRKLPDLGRYEWPVLVPLAALIFWLGVGTHYWVRPMSVPVGQTIPASSEAIRDDLPVATLLNQRWIEETYQAHREHGTIRLAPTGVPTHFPPGARPPFSMMPRGGRIPAGLSPNPQRRSAPRGVPFNNSPFSRPMPSPPQTPRAATPALPSGGNTK